MAETSTQAGGEARCRRVGAASKESPTARRDTEVCALWKSIFKHFLRVCLHSHPDGVHQLVAACHRHSQLLSFQVVGRHRLVCLFASLLKIFTSAVGSSSQWAEAGLGASPWS